MSVPETRHLPVGELIPFVNQSRETFDEPSLHELANDIKEHGQLQPGLAWFDPGRGQHILLCGERRRRAILMAELPTMEVKIVTGPLSPGRMLEINLAENLQRANLNAIERAKSFRRLGQLENLNDKQVASRMHISNATVSRDLSLLELPEALQLRIALGEIRPNVGYLLARVSDDDVRLDLAEQVMAGKLGREGLEGIIAGRASKTKTRPKMLRLLSCRLEGGLNVSVSGARAVSWPDLIAGFERLCDEARRLQQSGKKVSEFARSLRAS